MKEKIKIMKTRPRVTEAEIQSFMDFDFLLKQKETALNEQRGSRRIRNRLMVIVTVVTLSAVIWFLSSKEGSNLRPKADTMRVPPAASQAIVDTLDPGKQSALPRSQAPRKQNDGKTADIRSEITRPGEQTITAGKEEVLRQPVYVQAEPAEGYPFLYEYFDRNLVYPPSAVKDSIEGVVEVAFVIDTTGKATGISVEKSMGVAFDNEVIRLIANMPAWRPAAYNGKPVPSRISLPITFKIEKKYNP